MPRKASSEDGYASLTAIILCAALSLLCAGLLNQVATEKRQAEHQMRQLQQQEALHTVILHASAEIVRQRGDAPLLKVEGVETPAGPVIVRLRAEYEGRKWPLARFDEVSEDLVRQYGVEKADLGRWLTVTREAGVVPADDCLRRLFSSFGYADPGKALPTETGLIAMSGGHDGQVWRIRATSAGQLQEEYVRFIGDSARPFAVISQEDFALAQMPECKSIR